ncbi:MAG: patatin-like phospholipase family protein, partial [Halieaceae bacterium]
MDEDTGYRRLREGLVESYGDTAVMLAFSGGGTRAAALSYGVMQELRDSMLPTQNGNVRVLDEVESISSVSGGSFTSAYYGLYREKLFEDFEDDFLRLGVQQALIRQLFNPMHWIRSSFSGFDRTEMAIDYYDRMIFKGATFADLRANGPPFIDINATDLTTGLRFTFTQELFDMICTDLDEFSVARAVTASSAVPVAFPTVVLKNHADDCDVSNTREWQLLEEVEAQADTEAQREIINNLKSLRNAEERPYIHLVDGGIADNLGLRAMIDRFEGAGRTRYGTEQFRDSAPKNLVIILVNAEVKPDLLIEQTAAKPSVGSTMGAFTSAQMNRYNQETLDKLRDSLAAFEDMTAGNGKAINVYFAEVSFDSVKETEANRVLNSLPTSLE